MMVPEVYIHIGRPKTGTTAIQHFLFNYRQTLLDSDILYPDCGILDNAHHLIAVSLLQDLPHSIAHLPRKDSGLLQKELLGQIARYKPAKIIISSEFFSLMTPKNAREIRKNLKSFFAGLPVRIISYFRVQADYLESSYSQEIKNTEMLRPVDFNTFRESFLARRVNDYFWSCNNWAEVFGKENIIIKPFEKDQLVNGDVVTDLLYMLDANSLSRQYQPETKVNTSLSVPRMMLMNSLAELEISAEEKKLLASSIQKIPELPSEVGKYRSLNPALVAQIEDKYAESNAKLAKEYLGIHDQKLFHNNRKAKGCEEYNKLEFKFLYEFERSIYKTDQKCHQILKAALKNNCGNESLNILRRSIQKKYSLLAGVQYYLLRIIDRLH